jgi:hypothetical protein
MTTLSSGLPEALAGFAAVLASFLTMEAIGSRAGAGSSAAILAAVLALTLARRERNPQVPAWLNLAVLPLVGIASAFVGRLLLSVPLLGAALFVAALFVSVWLRRFGARASAIGALIALPFVTILIVPVRLHAPGGELVDLALIVCAGAVAIAWTAIARFAFERFGFATGPSPDRTVPVAPRAPSGGGLSASTRMALQMAVALAAAFAIGFVFFREHWGWLVLTAFIVCSGARGRGDAAYKGLLRLGGALAGTVVAAALQDVALPNGTATACAIFAALFLGMWLRERNYAYWAACITLVLALLARTESAPGLALLLVRLEAIFAGALCAVGATWFVYPIRTESVIRRRVADVLAALDELFQDAAAPPEERARKLAVVDHRAAAMNGVAPPVELHRRLFASDVTEHPAVWVAVVRDLLHHARERIERGPNDGHKPVLGAIRHARRAIGRRLSPEEEAALGDAPIHASLHRLGETLARREVGD